jgi:hypothetical protein
MSPELWTETDIWSHVTTSCQCMRYGFTVGVTSFLITQQAIKYYESTYGVRTDIYMHLPSSNGRQSSLNYLPVPLHAASFTSSHIHSYHMCQRIVVLMICIMLMIKDERNMGICTPRQPLSLDIMLIFLHSP